MAFAFRSLLFLAALGAPSLVYAQVGFSDLTRGYNENSFTNGAFVNADGAATGGHAAHNATDPSKVVPSDPKHVLQPQDVLKVEIFQEDDINAQCEELHVSNDYAITLPLIGSVSVKGKTLEQARQLITELYNKDYLVNPQIALTITKYADRSVNVMGSVEKQGRIDFPPQRDLTIIDAIALAGGQTRFADLRHVKLTQLDAQGEAETRDVDVARMMKGGGGDAIKLQPGDIVYVPERTL